MFCPKCREEFREGFTFCERCNENLVNELPSVAESTEVTQSRKLAAAKKDICIEKWLKRGAVVYVIVGILSDISYFITRIYAQNSSSIPGPRADWILFYTVDFFSAVVGSLLWGAFFYGFGRIIEILKEGFGNAQR